MRRYTAALPLAAMALGTAACSPALSVTPNPEPVQRDLGFPFFPDDERVTELARSW